MKDLVGLVADKKMEATLRNLLHREQAFGIRHIKEDVFAHPRHDPGVLLEAAKFLGVFTEQYRYALVMFDREGCGQEDKPTAELQGIVQEQLDATGWRDRSGVIVLNPELESWVWSDSPHVSNVLGVTQKSLREFLESSISLGTSKPSRPKELMEKVLRQSRVAWSGSLYAALAQKVSVERCTDPAFLQLKHYLEKWFSL